MLALNGYYDGKQIQTFEQVHAKKIKSSSLPCWMSSLRKNLKKLLSQQEVPCLNMPIPIYGLRRNPLGKKWQEKKLGLCRLHIICI